MDWKSIEEKYTPRARCVVCNFVQFKENFTQAQWSRKDKLRCCTACIKEKEKQGTPCRCNSCGLWKSKEAFPEKYRHPQSLTTRVCDDCIERRQCAACGLYKISAEFTVGEWAQATRKNTRGKCRDCSVRSKENKLCAGNCGLSLPVEYFTRRMWLAQDRDRKCLTCMERNKRGF